MNQYKVTTLVLVFVFVLVFPTLGTCYFNPGFPYFSGPIMNGGVSFYTDASPATLSSAIDVNLTNASFVNISHSPTGGYDLTTGSAPMGLPLEVCKYEDLSSVIGSYMNVFGSVIVGKETSGENSFYYIYPGLTRGFSSLIPSSMSQSGYLGIPVSPAAIPSIPINYMNTSEAPPQTDKVKDCFSGGASRCWLLVARYWINTKKFIMLPESRN